VVTDAWQRREALDLRYDGPIPAGEFPVADAVEALRRRMRLHRRLAMDYAGQARRTAGESARALRLLAAERRAHSALARVLGEMLGPS
jgi:hypothetical protein